jgi:hypothetical protein
MQSSGYEEQFGHSKNSKPERSLRTFGSATFNSILFEIYFGITSRANLLATTSRSSLRFFPASIMASREP